ncbi:hypothetical protein N7499_005283 [Penicillium canescens]|nr:hypothetical protein N7499_005283 [Penicillium canescens]KAJ6162427.1 hypothetical protein N7485_010657 [Penicillium canescens]
MERPTPDNNLENTPWSNSELDSWRTDVLRQSESFFVTSSPEPLAASTSVPAVGDPSYNYQLQFPAMPVIRNFVPPPTPVPSVYLSPNAFPKPIDQSNPEPVPVHSNTTALALENSYHDGYPCSWIDFTPSPSAPKLPGPNKEMDIKPTAAYLCPNTITRPINRRSLSSASIHSSSTAISPASPYDPGCPSPWTDVTFSPSASNRAGPLEEVSKKPAKTKRPCLTRGVSKQNHSDLYGTFKCEWVGCTYDRFFSRKGVLMRHIETQHVSPGAFKCPSCDHAASRKENLRAHRQSIHKETF